MLPGLDIQHAAIEESVEMLSCFANARNKIIHTRHNQNRCMSLKLAGCAWNWRARTLNKGATRHKLSPHADACESGES